MIIGKLQERELTFDLTVPSTKSVNASTTIRCYSVRVGRDHINRKIDKMRKNGNMGMLIKTWLWKITHIL